jgi:hypothetical protein
MAKSLPRKAVREGEEVAKVRKNFRDLARLYLKNWNPPKNR